MPLSEFYLNNNMLTGSIPNCLYNPSGDLLFLAVNNNYLDGTLSTNISQISSLSGLYIQNNYYTGPLPIFNEGLSSLYVQNNMLSGPITSLVVRNDSYTYGIVYIDLSNNEFTGTIPAALFTPMSYLQDIIPLYMESFSAAGNCLEGEL
jgi:hypothetical protein